MSRALQHAPFGVSGRQPCSVLLFADAPGVAFAASTLQADGLGVQVVTDLAACLQMLSSRTFEVLLLEESVTAIDGSAAERLYTAAGLAVVLEVNFGLADAERVAQAVQSALQRRRLEERGVALAARQSLQSEIGAALTGLLLESQLALRQAGPQWTPTLTRLVDLAEHVSSLVTGASPGPESEEVTILHHTTTGPGN